MNIEVRVTGDVTELISKLELLEMLHEYRIYWRCYRMNIEVRVTGDVE